jgi:hypothetical protein
MPMAKRFAQAGLVLACAVGAHAAHPAGKIVASIDLSKPFATRSRWHLTASQGADVRPDNSATGGSEPGVITLCVSRDGTKSCQPDLVAPLGVGRGDDDYYSDAHFVDTIQIVHPHGAKAAPLLIMQLASAHGGNGNQRVGTLVLRYDPGQDSFVSVYKYQVARNTNDQIRYLATGPLRGAIVSAEPTGDAPFGFWITVNQPTPSGRYKRVLHFRSATHYGDGNPLAVIDSEMPNIQRRLGLWRPGQPLPLPAKSCRKPHLVRMELWCS